MKRRIVASKRAALGLLAAMLLLTGSETAVADPLEEVRDLLLRAENFSATGFNTTQIYLSWTSSGIANKFRIESATEEGGLYNPVTTTGKCCAIVLTVGPAADSAVRWYRVVPIRDDIGLEGKPSLPDPAILGPRAPTNLTCNDGPVCENVTDITLEWTDNSDESRFWIMRARGFINPNFGYVPYQDLPANTTVFNEVLTELASTFLYKVVAVRIVNIPRIDGSITEERAFADSVNPATVRVDTPQLPPPASPTGLMATFQPPATAILTWTDNAPGADGFEEDGFFLEWGPKADQFEQQTALIRRTGKGTVSYTDSTLDPDVGRCYRVRAYRYAVIQQPAYSAYSPLPSEPGVCVGAVPKPPTNLVATAISNTRVDLMWTDNSETEGSFRIQRCNGTCTSSSTWTELALVPGDTTMYSDETVVSNTTYSYRVRAENATGNSAWSNIQTVKTPVAPLPKPTLLSVVPITSHRIRVTWQDNSTDETGFRIEYRSLYADEWDTLVDVAANVETYDDTFSLAPNQTRCYRVRALKGTAQSDPSNFLCAATLDPQPPNGTPSGLTATVDSNYEIDLEWNDTSTNEDLFRIEFLAFPDLECATAPNISGASWKKLTDIPASDDTGPVTHEAKGLIPHTAYFFRVKAVNGDGTSPASNVVCATTFGPKRPKFIDPNGSDDLQATRCTITLEAEVSDVDEIEIVITAQLPTGWVHEPAQRIHDPDPATGGPTTPEKWTLEYRFLKGPKYLIRANAIGYGPNNYRSATAEVSNVTVLADCPTGPPDPLP